jgi:hypothetical protein
MFTPFAFVKQADTAIAFTGLLDTYPNASRAYSVRKLRAAYTGSCLRVRRSSDDTTQNIGFDANGNLDTASITSFVGANNGFIDIWYDQSGNAKNATQTTNELQPQIVSSGTIITTGTRTSVESQSDLMVFDSVVTGRYTQLVVGKKLNATSNRLIGFAGDGTPAPPLLTHWSDSSFYFQWENNYAISDAAISNTDYEVIIASTTSADTATIARNGSTLASTRTAFTIGTTVSQILQYTNNVSTARVQELILWESEQNSNFTGIQNNINTYYSIY